MIHAICDFCGKDCDRNAMLLTLKAFQNFARHNSDTEPFGTVGVTKSFVICSECRRVHKLPNPYEPYSKIASQKLSYDKNLHNYTDLDLMTDFKERETE